MRFRLWMENSEIQLRTQKLYGSLPKLEETWGDIQAGRLSMMRGKSPIVTKIHGMRGIYLVQDGYHRIMEAVLSGTNLHSVTINPDQPILYQQGWEHMLRTAMSFTEYLKGKT